MTQKADLSNSTSDREFVITRIIDAPRERVFQAWTDQAQMAQWWGPHEFTNPVCEVDLRPGGAYRIVMRGPDGVEYPIKGIYGDIVAPERLVMTDNWEEHPEQWQEKLNEGGQGNTPREALNLVTFEERGGKTGLTIRTVFATAAVRDAMLKMGMSDGWSQSLERLNSLVNG